MGKYNIIKTRSTNYMERQKLSKQTHAPAIDNEDPMDLLNAAALHLGLGALGAKTPQAFYAAAQKSWSEKYLH